MANPFDPTYPAPSGTQAASDPASRRKGVPSQQPSGWSLSGPDIRAALDRSLTEAHDALARFQSNPAQLANLSAISAALSACFQSGNKVLACGNGGSACDAIHFAEEFTGRFRKHRRALPVIALAEAAHMTCVANDYGFDEVFARGVEAFGKPGDLLLAISTSGNSPNIIRAVETAKGLGMEVILLLGKNGGKLKGAGTLEIIVASETTERIQEIHMLALHVLIESVERTLFPENYR
jgi:D-sedoheptulose 7-phosphate isomerase